MCYVIAYTAKFVAGISRASVEYPVAVKRTDGFRAADDNCFRRSGNLR